MPTPTVPSQTATPAGHSRSGRTPQPQGEPGEGRAGQERPCGRKDACDDLPALVRVAADRREEQNQQRIGAGGQGRCLPGPQTRPGSVPGGRAGELGG